MRPLPGLPERYRYRARLGSGAFGSVHRAFDTRLGVDVAIKVLADNHAADVRHRTRFQREARAMRQATSPWIVTVHDFDELEDGRPYMVMAYANRGVLRRRLGTRPPDEVFLRLLDQLVRATAAVRDLGWVHRDIKPSNILVFGPSDGDQHDELLAEDETVRLGDFGLVTAIEGSRFTVPWGTEAYASPEQLRPGAAVDHRSDIFSLAVTLAEILDGRPRRGEEFHDASSEMPEPVRAILAECSDPDPARRPLRVEEMRIRLVPHFDGQPTIGWVEAGSKLVSRRRALAGGLTLGAMTTAVAAGRWLTGGDDTAKRLPPRSIGRSVPTTSGTETVAELASMPVDPVRIAGSEILLLDVRYVVSDGADNLFFSDRSGGTIWRRSPDGWVNRVAGGNGPGSGGDGGSALEARLDGPSGLAIDNDGGLIIGERNNRAIRRVDANGVISKLLGGLDVDEGVPSVDPTGLAVDADGRLLIADFDANVVWRLDENGELERLAGSGVIGFEGDLGPATDARLNGPTGLAVGQDGVVAISDQRNHRVRLVTRDGSIRTIAGNGAFREEVGEGQATRLALPVPWGLTYVGDDLVVVSSGSRSLRRIAEDGWMNTVASTSFGGSFTDDRLAGPSDVTALPGGELVVADPTGSRIHRIVEGGRVETIVGTGPGGLRGDHLPVAFAVVDTPTRLTVDPEGRLIVVQQREGIIRQLELGGAATTLIGGGRGVSPDGMEAAGAFLAGPIDVASGPQGELYVVEATGNRVRSVDSAGRLQTVIGTGEAGADDLDKPAIRTLLHQPSAATVDGRGLLYVADRQNRRVLRIDPSSSSVDLLTDASLVLPPFDPIALDTLGDDLVVADSLGRRLLVFELTDDGGRLQRVLSVPRKYGRAVALAVESSGSIYVATGEHVILQITEEAEVVAGTGDAGFGGDGGPAVEALLNQPQGLALGPEGGLIVGDSGNSRIRRVADGRITTVAGGFTGGRRQQPSGD